MVLRLNRNLANLSELNFRRPLCSELNDLQVRDQPEMAYIDRQHRKIEFQRSGAHK